MASLFLAHPVMLVGGSEFQCSSDLPSLAARWFHDLSAVSCFTILLVLLYR